MTLEDTINSTQNSQYDFHETTTFQQNGNENSYLAHKSYHVPDLVKEILKRRCVTPELDYIIEQHIHKITSKIMSPPHSTINSSNSETFADNDSGLFITSQPNHSNKCSNKTSRSSNNSGTAHWYNSHTANGHDDRTLDSKRQSNPDNRYPSSSLYTQSSGNYDSVINTFDSYAESRMNDPLPIPQTHTNHNSNYQNSYQDRRLHISEDFGTTPDTERIIQKKIENLGFGPSARPSWMTHYKYHEDHDSQQTDVFSLAAQTAAHEEKIQQQNYNNQYNYINRSPSEATIISQYRSQYQNNQNNTNGYHDNNNWFSEKDNSHLDDNFPDGSFQEWDSSAYKKNNKNHSSHNDRNFGGMFGESSIGNRNDKRYENGQQHFFH